MKLRIDKIIAGLHREGLEFVGLKVSCLSNATLIFTEFGSDLLPEYSGSGKHIHLFVC